MLRDTKDRGRDINNVLVQYNRFVKPAYDDYIKPTMKLADIIIPKGAYNKVAVNLVLQNLKAKLL